MGGQESRFYDDADYSKFARKTSSKKLLVPNRKAALNQNDEANCVVVTQIKQCKFKAAVEKVKQFKDVINQKDGEMPSYYHGWIRKAEVEQLLKQGPEGMFLVKNSTEFPGDLTLCVLNNQQISYFRITRSKNMITLDHINYFNNLDELIDEYKKESTLGVLLKLPCIQRSEWNQMRNDAPNLQVPVQSFIGCKSRMSFNCKTSKKRKQTKVEDMLIFNQES